MADSRDDMTCREVVELVNDYLEGVLTPPEGERFELHLRTCEGCRRYVAQMRFTIQALGRVREEELPAQVRDRLLAAFRDWKQI